MANSQIYLKEICSLEKSIYISVIRQKGEVAGKQSKPNFPKNEHRLPPDTHT